MRKVLSFIVVALPALALLWLVSPLGPTSNAFGAPGPHGGYMPTEDSCAACHGTHTAQAESLLMAPETGNAFCYTCHDGTGAPATPVVSTHSNIDFTGVEANFTLSCVSCHEPHGSSNLFAIRDNVVVEAGAPITVGPVVFIATSGIGSFDDGTSPTSSRLCVTCHESPDNQGYPMTDHVGAADHSGGVGYEGQNCTGCHPHSADGTRENFDGFMPVGGCTSCHAAPQDNGDGVPVGGRRAVTSDFLNNSHHVQGTVNDIDCVACHEMTQHQQGQVRLKDADTGAALALIDRPENDPTVGAVLEPWCLACHDADGAGGVAPFQDGVMPPVVDATAWNAAQHGGSQTCYDCHRNGHGSAYEPILLANYVTADFTNFSAPNYQLCFTCHIQNRVLGGSVRNAFNDYHDEHVLDRDAPCAHCHNPHYPYDAGESGLSNLSYPDIDLLTYDLSTAFTVGATTGECFLACHNETHSQHDYRRVNPGNTTGSSLAAITNDVGALATWDSAVGSMLADSCSACHVGPDPAGGLDVGSYLSALEGGVSGPGVVAGDPGASLIYSIQASGGHPGQLTDDQVAELLAWIEAGAPEK